MARKTVQNKITNPNKIAQVNPFNMRLKDDFLDYLKSLQRSPKTINGYDNDLLIVFVYILERAENKKFHELTKRELVGLQNWLVNENGNSPARTRRIKAAMSSMSNYIENVLDDEDEFKGFRSIVRKIENPPLQAVREKTVWSAEALDSLLEKLTLAGEHKKACAVALAMFSGRRKAELCRFKVDDFKKENLMCGGALYKTSAPIQTKGFGLGKFIHCFTLAKRFQPYFDAWMSQREEEGIESEWLLPSAADPSQQMDTSTFNSWAVTFSKMTGEDFYWHSLRSFFVTQLAREGLPDSVIVEIVGWSDSAMLKVYKDISAEEQIAQFFDEDGNIRKDAGKSLSDL